MCYLHPIRFKQGCQLLTYGSPSHPTQGQWIFLASYFCLFLLQTWLHHTVIKAHLYIERAVVVGSDNSPCDSVILEQCAIVWFNIIYY